MQECDFRSRLRSLCERDPRYDMEAYLFIREALDFTVQKLKKPAEGKGRHVTGQELLEGIRAYALQEFGPMALTVFRHWGISKTGDFGEIVFNLVEAELLGKTDDDTRADFSGGYDFEEAFAAPFLPRKPGKKRRRSSSRGKGDA